MRAAAGLELAFCHPYNGPIQQGGTCDESVGRPSKLVRNPVCVDFIRFRQRFRRWGQLRFQRRFEADYEAHHKLAREAAGESIVLLKNENEILPLDGSEKIAIIGGFAASPRYQGVGCSIVNPRKLLNPLEEIEATLSAED